MKNFNLAHLDYYTNFLAVFTENAQTSLQDAFLNMDYCKPFMFACPLFYELNKSNKLKAMNIDTYQL